MKLIQASLLGVVLTASAAAQHGASGGGHAGSGHASASFSSGRTFSMSAPAPSRTFSSASVYRPNATPAPFGGTQPPGHTNTNSYPYRYSGYRPYYNRGVYLVPGYLNYGFSGYGYGYADDAGYNEPQSGPATADAYAPAVGPDSGYQQAYSDVPPARPAYQPEAPAAPDLPEQPEVTLLFKDGRQPVQVQNYAVTRTTLYVLDGPRRREIPLDQLDLPQTEKTNRDAGVDFDVPVGD
jgi:hypothetical protein